MGIYIETPKNNSRTNKESHFRNGATVKPTGDILPEGKKRVYIPKHRITVYAPIDEPDEEVIKRVTDKFNNPTNIIIKGNAKNPS